MYNRHQALKGLKFSEILQNSSLQMGIFQYFVEFTLANCHKEQQMTGFVLQIRTKFTKGNLAKLMPQKLSFTKINCLKELLT